MGVAFTLNSVFLQRLYIKKPTQEELLLLTSVLVFMMGIFTIYLGLSLRKYKKWTYHVSWPFYLVITLLGVAVSKVLVLSLLLFIFNLHYIGKKGAKNIFYRTDNSTQ